MIHRIFLPALLVLSAAAQAGLPTSVEHHRIFERCIASTSRGTELRNSDIRQMERSRKVAAVTVPAQFRTALVRLKRVAQLPAGMNASLYGVDSSQSAFALSSGAIFVSSALWRTDVKLDAAEAAAVIAHELAHLELAHVKDRLCHAVASAGDERLALSAATQATHRAISAGSTQLAVPMMQRNHLRELDADTRAKELLGLIGMDPGAVARMLVKVSRVNGGGFSEFHPAVEVRLENLALQGGPSAVRVR